MAEIPDDINVTAANCFWEIMRDAPTQDIEGEACLSASIGREKIAAVLIAERERLETVRAQAYQVIGNLLERLGEFDTNEGIRALDYFSGDDCDEDFLPWPFVPSAIRTR